MQQYLVCCSSPSLSCTHDLIFVSLDFFTYTFHAHRWMQQHLVGGISLPCTQQQQQLQQQQQQQQQQMLTCVGDWQGALQQYGSMGYSITRSSLMICRPYLICSLSSTLSSTLSSSRSSSSMFMRNSKLLRL
jgi:hypothetical protein